MTMSATVNRRPRALPARERGELTRRRIIDAAMDLWATRGSRGTGLTEVAERAGVGHPGLLHHFGSKDNLRLAVVKERDRQDLARVRALVETGGLETIRALPVVARAAEERPGLAQLYVVLVAENLDPDAPAHDWLVERMRTLRQLLSTNLRAGVARGEIDASVDCDLMAARIMAFMDGVEIQRILDPARTDLETLYSDFARGLLAELAPHGRGE
jgi:AcrR family transcriptional regulator